MGLFSFVGKALGKIAKTGLSVVTRGASDKVLGIAKGLLGGKPKAAAQVASSRPPTIKDMAVLNAAIEPPRPQVQRTESRVEGWGFGPARKRQTAYKRRNPRAPLQRPAAARMAAKATTTRKTKKKKATGSVARSAPPGGLDLKAISAKWKAEGKPGTWLNFIKANSHIRKA